MTFAAPAESYECYMGRYSRPLAPLFADFAGVRPGMRVVDVGCGPGPLAEALAERIGLERVAAADPSAPFATACAARIPGAEVRQAHAERLPWPEGSFDAALAQLVVNFMRDPVAGVSEMRRVVRPGGTVAACVWDYGERMGMLRTFWDAALELDPQAPDEGRTMRFGDPDELRRLWLDAGLEEVRTEALEVERHYHSFDDYWLPFTTGIGPGGGYWASLSPEGRDALRERCRRRLGDPDGGFRLPARAWAVRGTRA
jgi:SAM-dependent methyltransferase